MCALSSHGISGQGAAACFSEQGFKEASSMIGGVKVGELFSWLFREEMVFVLPFIMVNFRLFGFKPNYWHFIMISLVHKT